MCGAVKIIFGNEDFLIFFIVSAVISFILGNFLSAMGKKFIERYRIDLYKYEYFCLAICSSFCIFYAISSLALVIDFFLLYENNYENNLFLAGFMMIVLRLTPVSWIIAGLVASSFAVVNKYLVKSTPLGDGRIFPLFYNYLLILGLFLFLGGGFGIIFSAFFSDDYYCEVIDSGKIFGASENTTNLIFFVMISFGMICLYIIPLWLLRESSLSSAALARTERLSQISIFFRLAFFVAILSAEAEMEDKTITITIMLAFLPLEFVIVLYLLCKMKVSQTRPSAVLLKKLSWMSLFIIFAPGLFPIQMFVAFWTFQLETKFWRGQLTNGSGVADDAGSGNLSPDAEPLSLAAVNNLYLLAEAGSCLYFVR